MPKTPVIVFGDVHLGVAPAEVETQLLAFLRQIPGRASSVIIMGDLFDFWFSWKHAMPRTGFRILAALADLTESGIPVLWIGGNHDCWGGDTLMSITGANYTLEKWEGKIGGWKAQIAHGDGLREVEDKPYRRLRTLLRNPLAIRLFGMLHPDMATWLALGSSSKSRNSRAADGGKGLAEIAEKWTLNSGSNLVIFGHSHIPDLKKMASGVYANAGAWYLDKQYLEIHEDRISMMKWRDSTEGQVLHTINLPTEKASN